VAAIIFAPGFLSRISAAQRSPAPPAPITSTSQFSVEEILNLAAIGKLYLEISYPVMDRITLKFAVKAFFIEKGALPAPNSIDGSYQRHKRVC
jgi:hypothetical protein